MNGRPDTIREVEERAERETKRPQYYNVFLLNDDYTTMAFVVHILERVFRKSPVEAAQIMLHVHKKGRGLAGVYIRDIAETKADAVHKLAREQEFPLRCKIEKV